MSSKQVRSLWGKEFHLVKDGLAQEEVAAFVGDLLKQLNTLREEEQRVSYLKKLAESTVTEAGRLAENMKKEAEECLARARAEAEESGRKTTEDLQRQAEARARREAGRILEAARREAAEIVSDARQQMDDEIGGVREAFVSRLRDILGRFEEMGEQTGEAVPVEKEDRATPAPSAGIVPRAVAEPEKPPREARAVGSPTVAVATSLDRTKTTNAKPSSTPTASSPSLEENRLFERDVEIGVRPPVDPTQLMRLTEKLERVPNLKVSGVSGSWKEGNVIGATAVRPVALIKILRAMPEVEKARLWSGEEGSDASFPLWFTDNPKPGGSRGNRMVVSLRDSF